MRSEEEVPFDRCSSDHHIDRLEDRIQALTSAITDVVRLQAELESVTSRIKNVEDALQRFDATIQTLNEARLNMMLLTKTINNNEKDIQQIKLDQAKQDEQDRVVEWVIRVLIGTGGLALSAIAFFFGTGDEP
jgi:prefoldin subunit 5